MSEEMAMIKAKKEAAGCTCYCPVYGNHLWESCPPGGSVCDCGASAMYNEEPDTSKWLQHLASGKCPRAAAQESSST